MFFKISALLSIFQVILATDSSNGYNFTDGVVIASHIYDDDDLKPIQEGLHQMQTMNTNLRLKIDLLEVTLNQQRNELMKGLEELRVALTEQSATQRHELKNDLEEIKSALTSQKESIMSMDSGKANLTDICGELSQQWIKQGNDMKKVMEEIKATTMRSLPTSCVDAVKESKRTGIYKIEIPYSGLEPFYAYCIKDSTGDTSAWLVIQRRQDGSVNFYRNWTDYQQGFGNLEGEFFIGLDKLHAMTQLTAQELWIQLGDFDGSTRWAKYNNFTVGTEGELYALKNLGNYTGDAGDALSDYRGMKWSTFDRDNDIWEGNCAQDRKGAFWFSSCSRCNLNGPYHGGHGGHGISWYNWLGWKTLKYVHMAIRPIQ